MAAEIIPPLDEEIPQPSPASEDSETETQVSPEELRRQRQIVIVASLVGVLLLALLIAAIYALALPSTDTGKIRDIFIIVMALESLIIGVSLIILAVQLARLINLLQNEIKPILESTQNTVNNLQGTTLFLSDHLVEPVMKLNEYLAALRSALDSLRIVRGK